MTDDKAAWPKKLHDVGKQELREDSAYRTRIRKLHQEAVKQGLESYIDPLSGYNVFTAEYHRKRGSCCESGCRHCPYGFRSEGGAQNTSKEGD